tara:strand:+ start:14907 stop:15044 length:138 start_codon:yes stop_codon:yes gene_type:complete
MRLGIGQIKESILERILALNRYYLPKIVEFRAYLKRVHQRDERFF